MRKTKYKKWAKVFNEKKYLLFILVTLFIILEYFILGPFSYIRPDSNADGPIPNHLWLSESMKTSGITFWFPQIGSGVDRLANITPSFNFNGIVFLILPGWCAYQLIVFLQVFMSGFFFYKLVREFLHFDEISSVISGSSICFMLIHRSDMIMFSGFLLLPFILWIIEQLFRYHDWKKYLLIFLIGFLYSALFGSMAFSLPFTLPAILFWFLFYRRQHSIKFIIFLLLFYIGCIIPQIQSISALLLNQSTSQRVEKYQLLINSSGKAIWYSAFKELYLSLSNQKLSLVIVLSVIILIKFRDRLVTMTVILWIFMVISHPFISPIYTLIQENFGLRFGFDFSRYRVLSYFLSAMMVGFLIQFTSKDNWIIARMNAAKIKKNWRLGTIIGVLIVIFLLFSNIKYKVQNMFFWLSHGNFVANYRSPQIEKLAKEIANSDLYRADVVGYSLGPAYLNTYGIETSGGHLSIYPKSYGRIWDLIVEPFVVRNKELISKEYFEGNRLYLFTPLTPFSEIVFKENYRLNLLSLLNVKYFVSEIPIRDEHLILKVAPAVALKDPSFKNILSLNKIDKGFKRLKENFVGKHHLYIYENTLVFPRFYFVKKIQIFEHDNELLKTMSSANIQSLRSTVFIDNKTADYFIKKKLPFVLSFSKSAIRIEKYSPDEIILSIDIDGNGILVVSNNYSPYWKCYVNGKEEQILRVNYTLWGVFMKSGKSEIVFKYKPPYKNTFFPIYKALFTSLPGLLLNTISGRER